MSETMNPAQADTCAMPSDTAGVEFPGEASPTAESTDAGLCSRQGGAVEDSGAVAAECKGGASGLQAVAGAGKDDAAPEPETPVGPAAERGAVSAGRMLKAFGCLCLVLVFSVGAGFLYMMHYVSSPKEENGTAVQVLVSRGTTYRALSEQLKSLGVIDHPALFRLRAHQRGLDGRVRVGRFLVRTDWAPDKVMQHLATGKVYMEWVTLSEGLPMWETARRLDAAGFVRTEDFEAVCREPGFLKAHRIPFPSAEGFLYPESYKIMRPLTLNRASARFVLGVMVDAFWKATRPLWGENPSPELVRRTMILASIVEKETSVASERGRVAGVYQNRLNTNMRLQADPTVIYGLGPSFTTPLRLHHLEDMGNPYNTYRREGLPPGPICSPGLACIRAALNPEQHDYLYFVAKGAASGAHTFSRTYEEHREAVAAYRAGRKKAQ